MRCMPPLSTVASMVAAIFLGRKTMMSPVPEASCEGPGNGIECCGFCDSGLIQAVILPSPVAA